MALLKVRKNDGTLLNIPVLKGDKGDKGDAGIGESPLAAYPIGALYWSSNPTSPADLFGGEWMQITDRFVLAAGYTYGNGVTGGEAEHVLTQDELPSAEIPIKKDMNTHGLNADWYLGYSNATHASTGSNENAWFSGSVTEANAATTDPLGSDVAHNNMPPYVVKYCWERTA